MIKRFMIKHLDDGLEADPCSSAAWKLVGRRLRRCRMQLGFDVGHVARNIGISPRTYETYESGIQVPASLLAQLADMFGVPVVSFFQDVASGEENTTRGDAPALHPPAYRVATVEHRVQALTDSFRRLDLEAQQHVLAISRALCRSSPNEVRD